MKQKYKRIDDVPEVCKSCESLDYDFKDEYSPSVYYCNKNLFLPTKTNSCKRHS